MGYLNSYAYFLLLMQDSYHQYNNRNNAIDKYYISQYNEGNDNILFEGNMIHMQRYTKKGVEIELIGPNTAEQGGYEFVDNSVTYYDDNGLNYQEFSTYHTFNCAEDGSVMLEDIDLHTKRYNAMYIQVRGKDEISGTIQGLSEYGNSEEVAFSTSTGYVDLAALEGLEWNIPYSSVRLTIDGGKANTRGSVEFISNASFEYELLSDTTILISITGGGAIVFDESLTRDCFRLCNAIIRKNITEAERVGLRQARRHWHLCRRSVRERSY